MAIPRPPAVRSAPCLEPSLCYLILSSIHRRGISVSVCKYGQAGPLLQDAGGGAGTLPARKFCSLGWSLGLDPPEASPLDLQGHILLLSLCLSFSVCQGLRIFLSAPPAPSSIWNLKPQHGFEERGFVKIMKD